MGSLLSDDDFFLARVCQYTIGAGAVLVLYDVLLTLPREIALIWPARWTIPKLAYLFLRYPTLIAMISIIYIQGGFAPPFSNYMCYQYVSVLSIYAGFGAWGLGNYLIALRVHVLYQGYVGWVTVLLGALWIGQWVPDLIIMSLNVQAWSLDPQGIVYTSTIGICSNHDRPKFLWALWPWPLVFQVGICALLAYKVAQRPEAVFKPTATLVSCLLADTVFYNVVILALEIVNLVFFAALPPALYWTAFIPEWSISSILIARMYLNLRDVASHQEWTEATSFGPTSFRVSDRRRRSPEDGMQMTELTQSSEWS